MLKLLNRWKTFILLMMIMLPFWKLEVSATGTPVTHYATDTNTIEKILAKANDGDIIDVGNNGNGITINVESGNELKPFIINKSVTITGGRLTVRRAGIIIEKDVTFKNMELDMIQGIYDAIFANGHTLTLENVTSGGWKADLFAGNIYTKENPDVPYSSNMGTHGKIIIKGNNSGFGNIYAGTMHGVQNIPVTIRLEKNLNGKETKVFCRGAHQGYYEADNFIGAKEPEDPIADDRFMVTKDVNVEILTASLVTVDGNTGMGNAHVTFRESEKGYESRHLLQNIGGLSVYPSDTGIKANLNLSATSSFAPEADVSVVENAKLNLTSLAEDTIFSFGDFTGGGLLVLNQLQSLMIGGQVSGETSVAIGGTNYDDSMSTKTITKNHNYIMADKEKVPDNAFTLIPYNDEVFSRNESGGWSVPQAETVIPTRVSSMAFDPGNVSVENGTKAVRLYFDASYTGTEAFPWITDVSPTVIMNGKEIPCVDLGYGDEYLSEELGIAMYFSAEDREYLYVYATDNTSLPDGTYDIRVKIPKNSTGNGLELTASVTLTIGEKGGNGEVPGGEVPEPEQPEITIISDISETINSVPQPYALGEVSDKVKAGMGYSASLVWSPEGARYEFNTEYTATVQLTLEENYAFAENINIGDWHTEKTDEGLKLTKSYGRTRKRSVISVLKPQDITLSAVGLTKEEIIELLPVKIEAVLEKGTDGGTETIYPDLLWEAEDFDISPERVNIFRWTIATEDFHDIYDLTGINVSGHIEVTNASDVDQEEPGPGGSSSDNDPEGGETPGGSSSDNDPEEGETPGDQEPEDGNQPGGSSSDNDPEEGETPGGSSSDNDPEEGETPGDQDPEDGKQPGGSSSDNDPGDQDPEDGTQPGGSSSDNDPEDDEGSSSDNDSDLPPQVIPEGLWMEEVEPVTYTGKKIKPEVKVYYKDILLTSHDYKVSYKNNTKAAAYNAVNPKGKNIAPTIIISGKGNYKGKVTKPFTILPIDLEEYKAGNNGLEIIPAFAKKTGKNSKAVPTLTINGKKVTSGMKEYVIEYNDTRPGAYVENGKWTVTVRGLGKNITGSTQVDYIVADKLITKASVTLDKASYPYDDNKGYTRPAVIIVKEGGRTLVEKTDYEVEFKNDHKAGTATILIHGKGQYTGIKTKTYKITGNKLKASMISITNPFTFDGKEKTMIQGRDYTVTDSGYVLKEGKDYLLSFSGNRRDSGSFNMKFIGINKYTGTVTKTVKIEKADINNANIVMETYEIPYSTGATTPRPKVYFGDYLLVEGKDYKLRYNNNKQPSLSTDEKAPTLYIEGKGNFKAKTLPLKFSIVESELSKETVLIAEDVLYADKKNNYIPKITLADKNSGRKLIAKKDYLTELSYEIWDKETGGFISLENSPLFSNDRISAKEESVRMRIAIQAAGNYKGSILAEYRIYPKSISSAKVMRISPMEYTGQEIKPAVEVYVKVKEGGRVKSIKLDESNYDVRYENNIKKGRAAVYISGKGEYGGVKKAGFNITSMQLRWWK